MAPNPLHVDIHLLHSTPYANLNRGRDGAPKTAVYGGVTRGRLSAQSQRRHTRSHPTTGLEALLGERAIRTRRVPQEVASILVDRGWKEDTALTAVQLMIAGLGIKGLGITEGGTTNALLFLPESAFTRFADLADHNRGALEKAATKVIRQRAASDGGAEDTSEDPAEEKTDSILATEGKKAVKEIRADIDKILHSRNAVIAAYGRMLANEPGSTTDGAIQVAHAISTHAVSPQIDFFTAVDDFTRSDTADTAGAAHMGDRRYTSATYYRYGTLNIRDLIRNLDGDIDTAFDVLTAWLRVMPTAVLPAMATTTAPHTLPSLVYATVRTDRPVSLADAFEKPISAGNAGYLVPSAEALSKYAEALNTFYGRADLHDHAHAKLVAAETPGLGDHIPSLDALIQRMVTSARAVL